MLVAGPAVDAAPAVAGEDGTPGHRDGTAVRHADEAGEADDGRYDHLRRDAVHHDVGLLDRDRLLGEHEHQGARLGTAQSGSYVALSTSVWATLRLQGQSRRVARAG